MSDKDAPKSERRLRSAIPSFASNGMVRRRAINIGFKAKHLARRSAVDNVKMDTAASNAAIVLINSMIRGKITAPQAAYPVDVGRIREARMKTRISWVTALVLVLTNASGHAADKPNIVFIMTDNLGYGDVSVFNGGPMRNAPTPRIDQLAAEGLRMTNFNVEPECTPSRSAFMTGRLPIRSGTSSVPLPGMPQGIDSVGIHPRGTARRRRIPLGAVRKMAPRRQAGALPDRPGLR